MVFELFIGLGCTWRVVEYMGWAWCVCGWVMRVLKCRKTQPLMQYNSFVEWYRDFVKKETSGYNGFTPVCPFTGGGGVVIPWSYHWTCPRSCLGRAIFWLGWYRPGLGTRIQLFSRNNGIFPSQDRVTPTTQYQDRCAVCLLRSRRKTFLFTYFFTCLFLVDKNGVAEGQFTSMVIEQMSEEETSQVRALYKSSIL